MAAYGQAYQAYQQNSVSTASPGELTLQLYNGCIKFIKVAKVAIEKDDIEGRNTNLKKAQNIIAELMVTLNPDYDITNQLLPLYDYINYCLREANIHNDVAKLDEAQKVVEQLRDTWKEAIKLDRQNKYAPGAKA
ncbi:flagellar export chaperone FliS [Alkalibacillus haloalkaliphilus]|uniref:flagellar export chaperone FliS n=1 Tax=Alkalibacillus haloalkaliphilus TaxID=94136 RepID=UPI0029364E42|nr:flagellar export chaperone FliS [Alkalibacillus haloalkaliphilus]MDV2582853.1 flagellar export chaperone FliS [Alkalibacillus haloalkaliphilus]